VHLQSLNADAFVSFIGGSQAARKAYLRLCFDCGANAVRAFNYVASSDTHRRNLVRDPEAPDRLRNLVALYWLRTPAPLKLGAEVLDPATIQERLAGGIGSLIDRRPQADVLHLGALLDIPWTPQDAAFTLDDYAFNLAIVSPNKGRMVVREWISVSLGRLRLRLRTYLNAIRIPTSSSRRPSARSSVL